MKTPCERDPEKWTSDRYGDRAEALRECQTCPRLAECHTETLAFIAGGLGVLGVSGGVDYMQSTAARLRGPAEIACGNPECDQIVIPNGTRRRFCSQPCSTRAAYLRKTGRVA